MQRCNKCNTIKDLDSFYKDRRSPNGSRRPICKECHCIYTLSRRSPYRKYKKTYCESCSFVALHPCQLDIDHIDGNHTNNNTSNLRTLCANCHRIKTRLNKEGGEKNDKG